jgi:hypothetical protein
VIQLKVETSGTCASDIRDGLPSAFIGSVVFWIGKERLQVKEWRMMLVWKKPESQRNLGRACDE